MRYSFGSCLFHDSWVLVQEVSKNTAEIIEILCVMIATGVFLYKPLLELEVDPPVGLPVPL